MNDTQKTNDPIDEMGKALDELELTIANRLGSLEAENTKLRAENAKLREALRSSLLFAEAVSTGREDGDDYAASDLARDLRDLIAGGE